MTKKDIVLELLERVGVSTTGSNPELIIYDERVFGRMFAGGTLGAGEAYMDGWWSSPKLDDLMTKLIRVRVDIELKKRPLLAVRLAVHVLWSRLINRQSILRSRIVGKQHYDIGNDLYEIMLDPWMQYSCGYWKSGINTLNEAQEAKLELIAKKLKLKSGMRVLDIGCGWGGLAKYLAQKYSVTVTGITISEEQANYASKWTTGDSVSIERIDYRELKTEPFDRIVSVGMFEHVGNKNYRTYMKRIYNLLTDDGIFLLDSIGTDITQKVTEPWIEKYIFPNGFIPSVSQVAEAGEGLFVMEDWHSFGDSYDQTLMAWYENFIAAWSSLSKSEKYDDQFFRMWEYYLLICAGSFRSREMNQWQIIFTKKDKAGGYTSVR